MTNQPRHSPLFRAAAVTAAVATGATLAAGPATAATGPTAPPSASTTATTSTALRWSGGAAQPGARRGELLSAVLIRELSPRQVRAELTGAGFDPALARHGVRLYRLVYRTVDPYGRPTTASGLLVLPRTGSRSPLTTVSYAHGTQVFRGNAPSVTTDDWETAAPITYAAAGFATVAADYLGLGLGPGWHPWMHVPSEITASV